MKKKSKIGFISLGCPKNQVDTEVMLADVVKAGYEVTPDDTEADIVIINTCAFIESAKQEAIDTILDVNWLRENRHLKGIVVTGCLSQRYKEEIFELMPEVDAIVGVGDIEKIAEAVEYAYKNGGKKDVPKYSCVTLPENAPLGGDRVVTTPDESPFAKWALQMERQTRLLSDSEAGATKHTPNGSGAKPRAVCGGQRTRGSVVAGRVEGTASGSACARQRWVALCAEAKP